MTDTTCCGLVYARLPTLLNNCYFWTDRSSKWLIDNPNDDARMTALCIEVETRLGLNLVNKFDKVHWCEGVNCETKKSDFAVGKRLVFSG